jgi:hypothetical protein
MHVHFSYSMCTFNGIGVNGSWKLVHPKVFLVVVVLSNNDNVFDVYSLYRYFLAFIRNCFITKQEVSKD